MAAAPERLTEISTRHAVYLQRLAAGDVQGVQKFLVEMQDIVRRQIAGTEITEFTRTRLETLLASIDRDLQSIAARMRGEIIDKALELASYEANFEIRSLNEVVKYDFVIPAPTQLRAAVLANPLTIPDSRFGGMMLEPFITDAMRPGLDRVTAAIRSGYYQGQTTNQILQTIRGTRAAGFTDGIWQIVDRDATSIVRTSLQHAANQARDATWQANRDIVKQVQWNATLEARTCAACGALDGQRFPMDKGPRPPLHPNCRCVTTAVLDERYNFLDDDATRFSRGSEGVRSVDANQSFYGWLKTQPIDFVETAIGKQKAKLLLDGGLSAQQFAELQLGKRFQPLTLTQMRELDPVAFTKAGIE